MNIKKEEILNFVYQLVARYALTKANRQAVNIFSQERGGYGTRGYGCNKKGVEIGWWVYPNRYKKELDWLLNALKLEGNEKILSVGCGPAFHEIVLAYYFPGLQIIATDFDSKEILTAQKIAHSLKVENIHFKVIGAEQINKVVKPHSVDRIISMAVLHDVANIDAVFCKMAQILKPSGQLVFTYNPGRRTAQFPGQPPLEEILERYLTLIYRGPLITSEDALQYYESIELKSRKQRGYGLVQEARIAVSKS